jgi:hypothetical protein
LKNKVDEEERHCIKIQQLKKAAKYLDQFKESICDSNCTQQIKSIVADMTYVRGFVLKSEDSYLTTSYFQVEDRISGGRFFKFTGNENPTNVLAHELFNCLTHHSYVISGGEYMLVDSQGSIKKLTDPEFHSNVADGNGNYGKSKNTGEGDLGVDGMNTFLASHVCGEICKCLTLDEQ